MGLNSTQGALASDRAHLVGETVTRERLFGSDRWPTLGAGARIALGHGFEVSVLSLIGPAASLDLGIRRALYAGPDVAAALALNLGGMVMAADQCRVLDDDNPCDEGSVVLSGALARFGVDLSYHWRAFAVYASPSVGHLQRSRSDSVTVNGRAFETDVDAAAVVYGSTIGVALGATEWVNLELGGYMTPAGRVLWVPAIGFRVGQRGR